MTVPRSMRSISGMVTGIRPISGRRGHRGPGGWAGPGPPGPDGGFEADGAGGGADRRAGCGGGDPAGDRRGDRGVHVQRAQRAGPGGVRRAAPGGQAPPGRTPAWMLAMMTQARARRFRCCRIRCPAMASGRAGPRAGDRVPQPVMAVRGDQRHAGQAAGGQAAQEGQPPGAVLGAGHVQAQDLPVPAAVDAGGDQGVHVDRAAALADVLGQGVDPHGGVRPGIQRPGRKLATISGNRHNVTCGHCGRSPNSALARIP